MFPDGSPGTKVSVSAADSKQPVDSIVETRDAERQDDATMQHRLQTATGGAEFANQAC